MSRSRHRRLRRCTLTFVAIAVVAGSLLLFAARNNKPSLLRKNIVEKEAAAAPSSKQHRHDHDRRQLMNLVEFTDPKSVEVRDSPPIESQQHQQQTYDPLEPMQDQQPQMYPFRDVSSYPGGPGGKAGFEWFADQFSDMSQCIDFKCSKDIDFCDNTSPTDYDGYGGLGFAPCCTHILRDILTVFDGTMSELGLDYFVGFGTLLGLIRSDRVIPWTIDNDIVVEQRTLRAMAELWNEENTGLRFAFPRSGKAQGGIPRMCVTQNFAGGGLLKWKATQKLAKAFHNRGFPYLDFYIGKNMSRNTWGNEYWRCRHFHSDVFPTKRQLVYGGQFALNFPRKPETLVERYYGLDWRTPQQEKKSHGNFRQICDVNYGLEELEKSHHKIKFNF